ncbi:fumarylacetoacetate hydrolase [Candidatus Pelagibacter sp.]|nr:fumarylacetoacetate hydrolase [Candidatus Pelagibacter sp.]|tara:strand:- start:2172 stop:2948 length:777 start_codon:yes stop_codon:yes gene_type:complete
MKQTILEKNVNRIVEAFLKNKVVAPLPNRFTKKLSEAEKFKKLCENKINEPIVGYKAGGTAIPVLKKLKEKKPFYASIFDRNLIKSGKKVKINKYTLGIELEVCYLIKKSFFKSKKLISHYNISKFISHMAPCIEVVGYRQRKKGISSLGDLCSDFGANIKFLVGSKKKFKKINIGNLKTSISNKKINYIVKGNTNTVYINPLNSLKFVLNNLKRDKINLNKDFWVFTGSTVGVAQIKRKGSYLGKIEELGTVKVIIT